MSTPAPRGVRRNAAALDWRERVRLAGAVLTGSHLIQGGDGRNHRRISGCGTDAGGHGRRDSLYDHGLWV